MLNLVSVESNQLGRTDQKSHPVLCTQTLYSPLRLALVKMGENLDMNLTQNTFAVHLNENIFLCLQVQECSSRICTVQQL